MKKNGLQHGLFHFASLTVACLFSGFLIGTLMGHGPDATVFSLIAGGAIGWNWRKVTGFSITLQGDKNDRT